MFPSFVDRLKTLGLVGMDKKDSSVVALVVSNGSYVLAGISGDDAFRTVLPSVFVWPRCSASWSVWARRTAMPCRRSSVGTFARAPCIRQSLDRCLLCLMSSGFGFWEKTSWKTCVFCVLVRQWITFMRHSTELLAHFHTFSTSGWTSDPGLLVSGSHLAVFARGVQEKLGYIGR